MACLKQLSALFFLFFSSLLLHCPMIITSSIPSFSPPPSLSNSSSPKCKTDESSALLRLKSYFLNAADDMTFSPPRKIGSWKDDTDCYSWEGVTWDPVTGHVIGLDLSASELSGNPLNSNSSLFLLSHLQRLSLALNIFNSTISSKIGLLKSLTHLDLSFCKYYGRVPREISSLSKLVSLDLTWNTGLILEKPTWGRLVRNLTKLEHLLLLSVNMSSIDVCSLRNLSTSLTSLDLSYSGLHGQLSDDIFSQPSTFRSLGSLDLSSTGISGEIPNSIGNLKSLESLSLSQCSLSGSVPTSIGNLTRLWKLDLGQNNLYGEFPSSLSNLTRLGRLDLGHNNLYGEFPSSLSNLKELTSIKLPANKFSGDFPTSLSNHSKIIEIDISYNQFSGELPASFLSNNKNLTDVDFSHNKFTGRIPTNMFINCTCLASVSFSDNSFVGPIPSLASELSNLTKLDLSKNKLNGTIPSWLYSLPSLSYLSLNNNLLSGHMNEFQFYSLESLNCSVNSLSGPIPSSIFKMVDLSLLYLSHNNFSGVLDLDLLPKLESIMILDLSFNAHISLSTYDSVNYTMPNYWSLYLSSCNITKLPKFLQSQSSLIVLDLSKNGIHGQIPTWIWKLCGNYSLLSLDLSDNFLSGSIGKISDLARLGILVLSNNSLEGPIPDLPPNIEVYMLSRNKLNGEIPSSICDSSAFYNLDILDFSFNNLSGIIPRCFRNMSKLRVLDLQMNNLQGDIPAPLKKEDCKIVFLNLNDNELKGSIPRSLANCKQLEVLDLGNNKINATFPSWLETLPNLQILVLHSNMLHGSIGNPKTRSSFRKLRVIDLSNNEFVGRLPAKYVEHFEGMMNVDNNPENLTYMQLDGLYTASMVVTIKGNDVEFSKIINIFTTIDFSSNNFTGGIPDSIGKLKSLKGLNLSHNCINGSIPSSLANLNNLEWLDLSSNMLTGQIPFELADLTFLSFLNLSENRLVGPIPRSTQLDTISNDSYIGNLGLCGFPLSKECDNNEGHEEPSPMQDGNYSEGFINGFDWKAVVLGYGSGTVIGILLGYYVLFIRRPDLVR